MSDSNELVENHGIALRLMTVSGAVIITAFCMTLFRMTCTDRRKEKKLMRLQLELLKCKSVKRDAVDEEPSFVYFDAPGTSHDAIPQDDVILLKPVRYSISHRAGVSLQSTEPDMYKDRRVSGCVCNHERRISVRSISPRSSVQSYPSAPVMWSQNSLQQINAVPSVPIDPECAAGGDIGFV